MRVLIVATTMAVIAGCADAGAHHAATEIRAPLPTPSTSPLSGSRVASSIVIGGDSLLNQETFVPPPAGLQPRLSAEQAWRAVQRRRPGHRRVLPIPATTHAVLGVLTLPPQVTDVLAWGFRRGPQVCVYTGMYQPKRPPPCYWWEFLSASTGRMLDSTEQEVRPSGVTPTPIPTQRLLASGFIAGDTSRFAPSEIVYQAPQSVIRWTFDERHCRIEEHWFEPVTTVGTTSLPSCEWRRAFSVDKVASFAGRGGDFEVVAGHQARREREYVRVTLADGKTSFYQEDSDAAWIFVVQRCGADPSGTAVAKVEEVSTKTHHVIASKTIAPRPARCP